MRYLKLVLKGSIVYILELDDIEKFLLKKWITTKFCQNKVILNTLVPKEYHTLHRNSIGLDISKRPRKFKSWIWKLVT